MASLGPPRSAPFRRRCGAGRCGNDRRRRSGYLLVRRRFRS
jgi:hypothetical protein